MQREKRKRSDRRRFHRVQAVYRSAIDGTPEKERNFSSLIETTQRKSLAAACTRVFIERPREIMRGWRAGAERAECNDTDIAAVTLNMFCPPQERGAFRGGICRLTTFDSRQIAFASTRTAFFSGENTILPPVSARERATGREIQSIQRRRKATHRGPALFTHFSLLHCCATTAVATTRLPVE